jgi:ABC-2 type transport system ATP-binding protein
LTGRELLEFHARLSGTPANAGALLELVGVGDAADRKIGEYSKGMQQRLGLAQALVGQPELVFLDEPTSALDPLGRLEVRDVLLGLRERDVTVFLNSHLLTEVEKVCDQVAVIDRGTVIAQGSIDQLVRDAEARIKVGRLEPVHLEDLRRRLEQRGVAGLSYLDGELRLPVESEARIPLLVAVVVESGLPVYQAGLARPSLEEIFVSLIREHEQRASERR